MASDAAIRDELARAAKAIGAPDSVEIVLERPRDPSHGDWATNLAMMLARPMKRKPRELAEEVVRHFDREKAGVSQVDIAGPGFVNFHVDPALMARLLAGVVRGDRDYGRATTGDGRRVNVEFVSANPTGPLHVGHGRQAALGDAIARLLEWTGWSVSREYYYNDAGVQIANLGRSVQARVHELAGATAAIPEGGYHGEYIREIAERYVAGHPDDRGGADVAAITTFAVRELRKEQDLDLRSFDVRFDTYFLESSLYSNGAVERTVARLAGQGMTYEHEGALWLKTTAFGDDKDRVMRKRDGSYTYFLPDVAYHVTKFERGFGRAINVQGADHHSTVTRVRAGLQALAMGIPEGYPEYVLHQMVTVMRGGEEVKISKRAGSYVTVRDLVDEVGKDAVRYFFLMRKGDSQLVFDVELARSQSLDNPVYYIQMAHARMSGIFRVGGIDPAAITADGVDFALLASDAEQELIKALLDFPALVAGAAAALEPHRIANYLHDTAKLVHAWYHDYHVLNEPEPIRRARLLLARASQVVLRNGLDILGISAPDRM
ncbi:MAG TPA: arginine--tRNA ligase [Gemmatimonadaceae bacterium]